MGNCLRRSDEKEKKLHLIVTRSKNDKFFTFMPFDLDPGLLPSMNKFNLESMLQQLAAEKTRFLELLPLCQPAESTLKKLIVEVQKGVNIQKNKCFELPEVFVRVSLHPDGPSFETSRSDLELPAWFYVLEIMHDVRAFKVIKFTAFEQKKETYVKVLATFEVDLEVIEDQKVKHEWFKMNRKTEGKKKSSKLLVRMQWIYDEQLLVKSMVEECSTKIQNIEELLLSHQISIN